MKPASYCRLAATIFALVALVHAYRLVEPFPILVGSFSVPEAASWAGVLVAAVLSALGFRAKA